MKLTKNQQEYAASIAVIGKSGKFPGAGNLAQFWRNLCSGVESITFFTDEELLSEGVDSELLRRPNYVKALGYLENADFFDAQFFGFTPHEARLIDPQHRVFLECAWEALEDAGYASDDPGMVGVYASSSMSRYMRNLWFNPEILNFSDPLEILTGNDKDHIAMRVSYKLNLKGPSICVQSACSSSLVAVHMACRSLLTYECDIALAGGVSIGVPFKNGYLYQEGGIASPDGHCRAFDAGANGTILGYGAGVVVLKRLFEAIKDGDNIQAIIRGSAVNNDGSNKVGYTAPSVDSQAGVVRSALAIARVPSETITYVEAHGTGTLLGDPIELTALSKAFRSGTGRKTRCAIGALKTNIGHLDVAAGVAGLIKTVLALEHKLLPPSLNFESPNPKAGFEASPFYVNTHLSEWNSDGVPRRAGVSSLGMGGTNAHLVLEEAPELDVERRDRKHHLLILSARTQAALESATARLADHLQTWANVRLPDVARTLQIGRKAFPYRRAVVCESTQEAFERLRDPNREGIAEGHADMRTRPVVFMFPGQGAQYPGMGAGLYRTEPVFREHADQCIELLRKCSGTDLKPVLYPDRPFGEADTSQFAQTHITQPALFLTEYALAKLWMHWGITPEAMVGHSLGEYVAACLSGVMSLEDALVIVAKRGLLMQQTQPGVMLAVSCSAKQLEMFINGTLAVAAINTPSNCVVSGDAEKIAALEVLLAKENISSQQISTSHAFHSELMDPIVGHFQREMAKVRLATPKIPYISNLTGGWITDEIATDPTKWAQHLRSTVRFADGLAALTASPDRIYLEVGPGRSLLSFVKLCCQEKPPALAVASMSRSKSSSQENRLLLESLGKLWTAGVQVDWSRHYTGAEARRVSLPTYPFERQRYFVRSTQRQTALLSEKPDSAHEHATPETTMSVAMSAMQDRPELSTTFVTPRNPIEQRILEVWRSVLGIDAIGTHDDFWELGGNSLLATQVISRLKETFHIPLPLRGLFDMPTIEKLAEEVARLQEASAYSRTGSQPSVASGFEGGTPTLRRVDRTGKLALSYGQERLWFINQLEPENVSYNIPGAVRVKGPVDVGSLKTTLREIVRRHESLRTCFVSVNGEPQQIIDAEIRVDLPVTELSHLGEAERETKARKLALEEAQQPFDLAHGPLFRVKLLRLGDQDHVLVFNMHHIVSDGWSVGVLAREVSAIYNSFSAGQPSPLPELQIQYADFSAWQRELLSGPLLEEQLGYWKRKLAGVEPLVLPTDRPRTSLLGQDGESACFAVPLELTEALKTLARKQGATLYMILFAAFQSLLSRYSGQYDITVGSPIAGRSWTETEALIGFFVNTLVLRIDLTGRPDSISLLQRVKETMLEAHAHQDVPFEKIVEVLLPQRDLSRSPLFQVLFSLQNVPWTKLKLGAAEMLPFDVHSGAAQFEISLILVETSSGIEIKVEYNTGLFEAASISRMIAHYQMLLSGTVTQPNQAVAVLPLLTADERKQVIEEWNRTEQEYPRRWVHELFENQAATNPDSPAVEYEGQQLTYHELNARANQLARWLRKLGVGPEARVGIYISRSLETVVAIMGILKSGGAYVPLEPGYPAERLAYMAQNAKLKLLLTQQRLKEQAEHYGIKVICLDGEPDEEQLECQSTANLELALQPENLAYVIYTSGSTGQPKGVGVSHDNLLHSTLARWRSYEKPVRRFLLLSSFAFDSSVAGIFWTLGQGGTLCLRSGTGQHDLDNLAHQIMQSGISHILCIPSLYEMLLQDGPEGFADSLQAVIVAGESCPSQLVRRHEQEAPQAILYNEYGPTEASVWCTVYRHQAGQVCSLIPIGRPIANARVYILDMHMQPVPVGVAGELFVGGSGVARGYLERPELTAEKFLPDPFSENSGARFYRTGDNVRYLADGTIEYLGRIDGQLKIRGYRIELGEIEAALRGHGSVSQAVVIAWEGAGGDKRLVAYVVPEGIGESNHGSGRVGVRISELREHLLAKLPEYMVPTEYVQLEKIPLTHNGKIDRNSLPEPDKGIPEQEYVEPRNATEETLCRLWQELLRRERVGIRDNFFKIGGHSLLAVQVAARTRETFKVEIPLRRIFELPTIAQLAGFIDQTVPSNGANGANGTNGASSQSRPAIKRVARKAALVDVD